jgi:hypothetical protein
VWVSELIADDEECRHFGSGRKNPSFTAASGSTFTTSSTGSKRGTFATNLSERVGERTSEINLC